MTSRRSFIKSTALLSAAGLVLPNSSLFALQKKQYIGLQLYTVRDAIAKDPIATLEQVAKIGYNSVEGATYTGTQKFYGMDPAQFSKVLKDNGLIMPSSHYRVGEEKINGETQKGTMLREWDKAVDDAAAIGMKYMTCAYLSVPERGNLDHYKKLAEIFNKSGETCKKAGIQFCYHNHDFEFDKQDGKYPYDVLMQETDKNLVKMEMDMYWINKAGQDALDLFNKYPDRFPLWHVKDMDKTAAKDFTEVGNGSIDFKRIFAQAKRTGMQYFFVEQDKTPGSPFDSIAQSMSYIKKNLI